MTLLTVDAVAEILSVHTRTVRRYIKEKRLSAQKVGGQWRVTPDSLKLFMGIDSFEEIANRNLSEERSIKFSHDFSSVERITVSAVVDVLVRSRDEADRVSATLLAAIQCREGSGGTRCDGIYHENDGKLRFMLWGSPDFISRIMQSLEVIV